jgi:hypothetical protein
LSSSGGSMMKSRFTARAPAGRRKEGYFLAAGAAGSFRRPPDWFAM